LKRLHKRRFKFSLTDVSFHFPLNDPHQRKFQLPGGSSHLLSKSGITMTTSGS
jgi:hypothetical protein